MTKVIYLVGVPGSGKSTLVSQALDALPDPCAPCNDPIPHERYGDVWHIGARREVFGGTDTLSMSIQPKAIEWVRSMDLATHCAVLIGEGDRLANNAFLNAVRGAGHGLTVIHLDVSLAVARMRASQRAEAHGMKEQNAAWWKGRATKISNLVNSRRVQRWDGCGPRGELVPLLTAMIETV